MTSHHYSTEFDSGATDSVTSSPRSDHPLANQRSSINDDHNPPRVRFMCSFGGKILPRPHDNQLRYVGGDTRIVAVHRHTSFSSLLHKLSKLSGAANISVKYQLPNEDLDALITVTTDEDVENMMEEFDRFSAGNHHNPNAARLRLFLFSNDTVSRTSSISSLLDGSTKREHWFLDALNGGSGLERGRSEVSSIVSEMPDYLFGLDNSDEQHPPPPKIKAQLNLADTVSNSDPGSPAPVVSSPFCSTSLSLVQPIPELPPVKIKPDNSVPVSESKEVQIENYQETVEQQVVSRTGYGVNPQWHYVPDPHYPAMQQIPVYYLPGSVPQGNVPVQQVPIRASYIQQFPTPPSQIPAGFRQMVPGMGQVYGGGGPRPVAAVDPYDMSVRVVQESLNQPVYYGVRNPYPDMVVPGGKEPQINGSEGNMGRVSHS